MRIQHNIAAMNSYRNFSNNASKLNKNLEKLSTGYKINRAGDDAAGLAISEKMRAQITGLEGATKNAKDGISLIQTAEGALTEVHDMLNRMTTLAEQSANGTYDDSLDRVQLQKEVQALKDEIDRIADSTNFNGLKLLDGSLASNEADVANNETQLMTVKGTKLDGSANSAAGKISTKFADAVGNSYSHTLAAAPAGTTFEALSFKFTDKDGASHELTLASSDAGTITSAGDLVAALNGTSDTRKMTVTTTGDEDPNDVLRTFRETFEASSTGTTNLTLTVKNEAKGARLDATYGDAAGATMDAALLKATGNSTTNPTAITPTESKGKDAGLVVTIGDGTAGTTTKAAAGDRVQIGSKVYEFVDTVTGKPTTAGATAVHNGADKTESTKNLLAALKADGYAAELETNGTEGKIRFTNLDQISEAQGGGSVSVASDNLAVRDQEATKQTTTFNVGTKTDNKTDTITVSISYVDADGKNQSKEISVSPTEATPTKAGLATDIMNKLKDDNDLNGLFEFELDSADANKETIKITSRSTDNTMNQIGSITAKSTLATGGAGNLATTTEITAGLNDGKSIELKDDGQNIKAGDTVTVNGKTYEFAAHSGAVVGEGNVRVLMGSEGKESLKNLSAALTENGIKNSYDAATGKVVFSDRDNIREATSGGLSLQIGDTADSYNKLTVSVEDMHSSTIGIGDVDISTQEGASAALDKIKGAINFVSNTRGTLGALQNRLDHTINNLGVMRENIQNAESNIRDTDVAEEMMTYTKNNILNQSAQAMLAQANQLPQGVLQLLG